MKFNYFSNASATKWNQYVNKINQNHILQLSAYGSARSILGWKVQRPVLLNDEQKIVAGFQIISKRASNDLRIGYIPPSGPYADEMVLWNILFETYLEKNQGNLDLIKWEPGYCDKKIINETLEKWNFVKSTDTIQPPRTIIIDLHGDEESLLMRMNRRARRSIKKSMESPIKFQIGSKEMARKICDLLIKRFHAKGLTPYDIEYYISFFDHYYDLGAAIAIGAYIDKKIIAGRLLFFNKGGAYNIFGASLGSFSEMQPNYGLDWYAIIWAQKQGIKLFDFWGIPDHEEDFLEGNFQIRRDGLWGVYEYKRGFGGKVTRTLGAYDLYLKESER